MLLQPIQECKLHYLRPSRMCWKGLKNLRCLYSHPSFNTIIWSIIWCTTHQTASSAADCIWSQHHLLCMWWDRRHWDSPQNMWMCKALQKASENWCRFRTLLHDPMCNPLLSWIWTLILKELWWHFFPQTVFPQSIYQPVDRSHTHISTATLLLFLLLVD